ncbi:MAG: protoglobin domain-containing protein [Pirellulales bacterium]
MQHIDEARLETDLAYRFQYLTEFMGFSGEDIAAIHGAAPLLAPLVPTLVDAVYDKLHGYDATWRHFLPRQSGFEGQAPTSLDDVTMDHEQIRFRKDHLAATWHRSSPALTTAKWSCTSTWSARCTRRRPDRSN